MATWTVRVDMPPRGVLEESEERVELTDEAMAEETEYRQEFLDFVTPRLQALIDRPLQRASNVLTAEIHGANTWRKLNHYLLLITVDVGGVGVKPRDLLPKGAKAEVVGAYDPLVVLQ